MNPQNCPLAPLALCLMGPTASGKTDLALALAKHLPIEIINVDSAQIYLQMDIGVGKVSKEIRSKIDHHLIDFLDPKIPYSAAQFRIDALAAMDNIVKRDRLPVLVGGTMLYFKALQQGLSVLPSADPIVRKRLEEKAADQGYAALYSYLQQVDPLCASKIKPSDRQRIGRALEIYEMTGQPMSYWLSQPLEDLPGYQFVNIALIPLTTPRSELHSRIRERFDLMLQQGLVAEVERLLNRGDLNLSMPSLRAVGYRQVAHYLLGNLTYEQMREQAIAATRQLAKRQLTWIRQWPQINTVDFLDPECLSKILCLSRNT